MTREDPELWTTTDIMEFLKFKNITTAATVMASWGVPSVGTRIINGKNRKLYRAEDVQYASANQLGQGARKNFKDNWV